MTSTRSDRAGVTHGARPLERGRALLPMPRIEPAFLGRPPRFLAMAPSDLPPHRLEDEPALVGFEPVDLLDGPRRQGDGDSDACRGMIVPRPGCQAPAPRRSASTLARQVEGCCRVHVRARAGSRGRTRKHAAAWHFRVDFRVLDAEVRIANLVADAIGSSWSPGWSQRSEAARAARGGRMLRSRRDSRSSASPGSSRSERVLPTILPETPCWGVGDVGKPT